MREHSNGQLAHSRPGGSHTLVDIDSSGAWTTLRQCVSARGAGARQFYVPGVAYPHLHVGGDFVRWSNGNGGGRYVIDHGGRVHLDTIAELLRETADPDARAVLQAIAGEPA